MIVESLLLLLLLTYFLVFFIFAVVKGRKYLKSYNSGKDNLDYFFHSQNFSLTMSGLSVTALALIVSLNYAKLASFSSILLFFSISFVTLALSWNLIRFPREIYHFVSHILCDIGVLSIGCGFLVFFLRNLTLSYFELPITFGLFILSFVLLAILELIKLNKFWSLSAEGESTQLELQESQKSNPSQNEKLMAEKKFDKDIELQKIAVASESYHSYFNIAGSILGGGLVALVILILTLLYNQPLFAIIMVVAEAIIFLIAFIWNDRRNKTFLRLVDKWFEKIEEEQSLPPVSEMKKGKI